jgi:hypothetical protein
MKRNVALNGLDAPDEDTCEAAVRPTVVDTAESKKPLAKVRINEGDAWCASSSQFDGL